MTNIKPVLILERVKDRLQMNESARARQEYIMEGIFTQFMLRNRNERVYTADKFLPHLDELMAIKQELGVIYGEYDHPDVFDTSLSRVSHTIESTKYVQEHNRVDGAIRLTNTYWGKEAKALVDDNLPLFISSRAAGVTESNGVVEVKKLFTYDIVANPGFSSAKLNMKIMNESCGFDAVTPTSTIQIYDLTDTVSTNQFFAENNSDNKTKAEMNQYMNYLQQEVLKVKKEITAQISESNVKNLDPAKIDKIYEYQEALHKTMAHIMEYMDYLSENITISLNETSALNVKTDAIVEHNDYLATEVEKSINYGNYITVKLNESIHLTHQVSERVEQNTIFSNYIVEHLNNNISYAEYMNEHLNKAIRFGNYICEQVDATIGYTNLLAEQFNNSVEYFDYIREQVNTNIHYTEMVGKSVNKMIDYSNYISNTLDTTIAYTNLLGENLSNTMEFADYVIECTDKSMQYTEMVGKTITKGKLNESVSIPTGDEFLEVAEDDNDDKMLSDADNTMEEEEGAECKVPTTTEVDVELQEVLAESVNYKIGNVSNKIDMLIAEAMKKEASIEEVPHFYHFLTKEDIKNFESLSDSDKETVKLALNESQGYYHRTDVFKIMQRTLSKDTTETPADKLIKAIPADLQPIWESCSEKEKARLIAQSSIYVLETDEERQIFWSNAKFSVNESKKHISHTEQFIQNDSLSDNDIQGFMSKFKMLG